MKIHGFFISLCLALTVIGCGNDSNNSSEGNGFCDYPAPLNGTLDKNAPGYIVVFKEAVETTAEVNRLIEKYEIEVGTIYGHALNGFFGTMSDITVELVRCESSVEYVNFNSTFELTSN